jgi:hypothetical protein
MGSAVAQILFSPKRIASNVERMKASGGDQETSVAIEGATFEHGTCNEVDEVDTVNIPKHTALESRKKSMNSRKATASKFTGVYLTKGKRSSPFVARTIINHRGKTLYLGSWTLRTDAARARDRACKLLKGENCTGLNFASRKDYIIQRAKELENLEVDSENNMEVVESLSSVSERITNLLSKIPCPEIDAKYNEAIEKWGRHLPQETGKMFLDSYQKTVDDLFTNTTPPDMELESTPHNDENEAVVSVAVSNICDEPADLSDDDDASLFSSVAEASAHSDVECSTSSADDDASLFSSVAEASASDVECSEPSEMANAVDADQNRTMFTGERTEETSIIKLPIGCPVMWNFVGTIFCTGTISSALDSAAMYKVTPSNTRGGDSSSISISAKVLGFGIDCPVLISPACGSGTQLLQGKVLFGTRDPFSANNFSYCVIVNEEQNEFQVLKGVSAERLTYRMADHVHHEAAHDNRTMVRDEYHATM